MSSRKHDLLRVLKVPSLTNKVTKVKTNPNTHKEHGPLLLSLPLLSSLSLPSSAPPPSPSLFLSLEPVITLSLRVLVTALWICSLLTPIHRPSTPQCVGSRGNVYVCVGGGLVTGFSEPSAMSPGVLEACCGFSSLLSSCSSLSPLLSPFLPLLHLHSLIPSHILLQLFSLYPSLSPLPLPLSPCPSSTSSLPPTPSSSLPVLSSLIIRG